MMDELDEEMDEEDQSTNGATGSPIRLGPDVGLSVQERRDSYNNPTWRLQVR